MALNSDTGRTADPLKVGYMHLSVVNLTSGNPGSLNKRNRLSLTKLLQVSLYFVTLNPVAGNLVFHISKPGRLHPVQSHSAPARDDSQPGAAARALSNYPPNRSNSIPKSARLPPMPQSGGAIDIAWSVSASLIETHKLLKKQTDTVIHTQVDT